MAESAEPSPKSDAIRAVVRIRPLAKSETEEGAESCLSVSADAKRVGVRGREFPFDGVFDEASTQEDVYKSEALPLVARCFDGYNSTVLAYGQTGSGKTYTTGSGADMVNGRDSAGDGIMPRVVRRCGPVSRCEDCRLQVRAVRR